MADGKIGCAVVSTAEAGREWKMEGEGASVKHSRCTESVLVYMVVSSFQRKYILV